MCEVYKKDKAFIKSAFAILEIYQRIEEDYGGIVTIKEMEELDSFPTIIYCIQTNSFMVVCDVVSAPVISFHKYSQAEEFLKNLENIQLLKDYFMCN